ncbi:hypothetical protein [Sedimentitalea nanhaiensis]|uniref:Uncharacterized protein n=1 Tax=Sedimentitalea nanhaiensis TaxID=999627 RepID=A0A1I7C060_9RHOB|nr:hypothetical protein [Sedimentitalea nanhaiensis]SFT92795.1 hypothetical protein SAMN05216236_11367 [Sedimentitalea nanhaiensis]
MGKILRLIVAGAMVAGSTAQVSAQGVGTAASEARVRLACGTGRVVSAETLANGSIKVTCEQQARLPSQLGLAGLTPEATAAIIATVVLLPLILNDDDDGTNVTTTSTTPGEGP